MNKVTIITGGSRSNKYIKVDAVIGDRTSAIVQDYVTERQIKDLIGVVDVLVFEEVNLRNRKPLTALINTNSCLVRKPYSPESVSIPRPELIILSDDRHLFDGTAFGEGSFIEYVKY